MRIIRLVLLAYLSIWAGPLFPAESFDLRQLEWLEGSWAGTRVGIDMEEIWTSAKGGALLGLHRDVKAGRMTSFEFLRIQTTSEGTFYYASPRSAPPTAFKLVTVRGRHATFENTEHDFPQRIQYWLDADDVLHARIEGPIDGKTVSEEWAWKRVQSSQR